MCKTLSIGVKNDSNINYIDISFQNSEDVDSFCDTLAEYIISKYERKLIYRTINNNFCYFNGYEKRQIYNNIVTEREANRLDGQLYARCHRIIKEKLFDYVSHSDKMLLDGFVTFRLYEYICELERFVDRAVDEYLAQKEYDEFIGLLKYFVQIQTPQERHVHIIAEPSGHYRILNEDCEEITRACISDFLTEIACGEINYDDLIISALITIAPLKVTLHHTELIQNTQVVETIKRVFENRVELCNSCEKCNTTSSIQQTILAKQ